MKAEIFTKPKKEFQPFEVKLKIETIEEARLLFHVFNHGNLVNVIFSSNGYGIFGYAKEVASEFRCNFHNAIKNEIEEQGFTL